MKLTCPYCNSDQLDQGLDKKIICHECKHYYLMSPIWVDPVIHLENIER